MLHDDYFQMTKSRLKFENCLQNASLIEIDEKVKENLTVVMSYCSYMMALMTEGIIKFINFY